MSHHTTESPPSKPASNDVRGGVERALVAALGSVDALHEYIVPKLNAGMQHAEMLQHLKAISGRNVSPGWLTNWLKRHYIRVAYYERVTRDDE